MTSVLVGVDVPVCRENSHTPGLYKNARHHYDGVKVHIEQRIRIRHKE